MPSSAQPITSEQQLVMYFHEAAKPARAWRVGIEQEKIGVRSDGSPVPYDGPTGIAELLGRLRARGHTPYLEDGHVIALSRDGAQITLEPGGQVEFSGPAVATGRDAAAALRRHLRDLRECSAGLDIRFIAGGFRPFGSIDDVPWLPKRRYKVMRAYLQGAGRRLGHEMMKRTATVQANLDFKDEQDAVERMRAAMGITSVVTALFAASPISEGRPNGFKSYRAAVWLEMDDARCGLLPFVFQSQFSFGDYVQWALDVPMFFVVRDGHYHGGVDMTFRRFLGEGWQGQPATIADWEIHLSTLFPEVRLKRYIEVRGADAAPLPVTDGLAALWRGLLDAPEARAAAWGLVEGASMDERERVRREVPRSGLATRLGGRALWEIAVELCRLARAGLQQLPGGRDDQALLEPLIAYAAQGRCPADDMLADFSRAGGDPTKLVDAWEIPVD